jgi:hypothetical protein
VPERPLLLLPSAAPAERGKKGGGGAGPAPLGRTRQQERLGPRLAELSAAFESRRVQLQANAAGVAPEDVLVIETAGTVEEFVKALRRVDGFEFLAEFDELEVPADDDFFAIKKEQRVGYTGRVYLVFTNQAAFAQLLRLWGVWQSSAPFPRGLAKWREVFELLRDIRPWNASDRLEETGVLDDWSERVESGEEFVPCEIELWYRDSELTRNAASNSVRVRIAELGGIVLQEATVEGIRYHALAVRLPIQAVELMLDSESRANVRLAQSEQIQFFRASGQMAAPEQGVVVQRGTEFEGDAPAGDPVVALFDGLPLQRHLALESRLVVDDPDGYEQLYAADSRWHGTAMASLIVWGDLHDEGRVPIPQPLYVRPILQPNIPPAGINLPANEQVAESVLIVDLLHRAVRRLFEADGVDAPVAPRVAVVNLSVGIRDRPFSGVLSPLAKLLDWLAWKYSVLFVVSAGNYSDAVQPGMPWSALEVGPPENISTAVLKALAGDSRNRRTLSPAEAMNVLTVGSLHDDADTAAFHAGTHLDPIPRGLPSPFNAHGPGYRRSIKPDVLAAGGRIQFVKPILSGATELKLTRTASAPGMLVAAPGPLSADLGHTSRSRGTSNSAALLSHAAALLIPAIEELREGEGADSLQGISNALLVKLLLAHSARWGAAGTEIRSRLQTRRGAKEVAATLTRLLGFGGVSASDIGTCTPYRVTGIGGGVLSEGSGAEHRFPLPPSLSGKRGLRRVTVTLAWFTPVSPLSHRWRSAHLWFENPKSKLRVNREGPDWQATQRGTLQHDTFVGDDAVAFVEGDDLVVKVSCREDAPSLTTPVPYSLAVTLEVETSIGIEIYEEVRERVRQRLRVEAQGAN